MFDFLKKKRKDTAKPGFNLNEEAVAPDADEAIDEVDRALMKAEQAKRDERDRLLEEERRRWSARSCRC